MNIYLFSVKQKKKKKSKKTHKNNLKENFSWQTKMSVVRIYSTLKINNDNKNLTNSEVNTSSWHYPQVHWSY